MLDEIYDIDEALTEDEFYDALVYLLGDAYPDLTEEELGDLLEDILDQLPAQNAESVLNTVGTIGKKFGTGALKFAADNPAVVKGGLKAAGMIIGGPIGAKVAGGLGDLLTQSGKNKPVPEAGKMLKMMQDPQAQAAMALHTMGIGNGVAPLSLNGNQGVIPAQLYLRAMIHVAQATLKEMDRNNIIPPAAYSEALPFADDVDRQAEWLAEQIVGIGNEDLPFNLSVNTYFIYSTGAIEKYEFESSNLIAYVYVDTTGTHHNLGMFDLLYAGQWKKEPDKPWQQSKSALTTLVNIKTLQPYASPSVNLAVKKWDAEEYQRYYIHPDCLAGLLGAMAENNIQDLKFNGSSHKDGSSSPSATHYNGEATDLGYLTLDLSASNCLVGTANFDYDRQIMFNNSLYKFGFARNSELMYSDYFSYKGEKTKLPYTTYSKGHDNHLHLRGFDHSLIKLLQYPPSSYVQIKVPLNPTEPDATRVFRNNPPAYNLKNSK